VIRLVVALPGEARPLISHFGLKQAADAEGFRVFLSDEMALVVSGMGRVATAAATAYLHGFLGGGRHGVWLNVGIAGHRTRSVGDAVLAHKIVEAASARCWYPPLVIDTPCPTAEVLTVDSPEQAYPRDVIYEMEASGFYPIACRFSTSELVHVLKIVSDNLGNPTSRLTPNRVQALIERQLDAIAALIAGIAALAGELIATEAIPASLGKALERWHFTVSERRRLVKLLRHYELLYPDTDQMPQAVDARTAKDVLRWLEARIAASPVRLI
jgi:nucleoside phosphorylase